MKSISNKITHSAKRIFQRIYIGIHRKMTVETEPKSPYYLECIKVCSKLLNCKETILLIAPISFKRHIKNEKYGIYVSVHGRSIEVTNHVYSYNVQLDPKTLEQITKDFDLELEKRTLQFEEEISRNIKHSLKIILKNIENKDESREKN